MRARDLALLAIPAGVLVLATKGLWRLANAVCEARAARLPAADALEGALLFGAAVWGLAAFVLVVVVIDLSPSRKPEKSNPKEGS